MIRCKCVQLDALCPEALSGQYNVGGTPGCRCEASPPQKHWTLLYCDLSATGGEKSKTRFGCRDEVAIIETHLQNYATLREVVERWSFFGHRTIGLEPGVSQSRAICR